MLEFVFVNMSASVEININNNRLFNAALWNFQPNFLISSCNLKHLKQLGTGLSVIFIHYYCSDRIVIPMIHGRFFREYTFASIESCSFFNTCISRSWRIVFRFGSALDVLVINLQAAKDLIAPARGIPREDIKVCRTLSTEVINCSYPHILYPCHSG